jgi:small-conductance mechanosensitive channel/CRP-like cAMP-binding protein
VRFVLPFAADFSFTGRIQSLGNLMLNGLFAGSGYVIAAVFVAALVLLRVAKSERRVIALVLATFMIATVTLAYTPGPDASGALKTASLAFKLALFADVVAVISLIGFGIFRVLLPTLRFASPRILQDVVVSVAHIAWIMVFLRMAFDWDFASVIATSAVLTAVIGFSMQDTLGNILGGLAIQLDQSIHKGDWIKVDDLVGKVVETRWRYTAVETRNWETVLIPNSALMKNRFMVLGRREGEPVQWRRWVWFNVDFRTPPAKVIETVNTAIRSADIARVSKRPDPNCVLMDFTESYGRYALRYWLTDLAVDDPTDSEVRAHIYVALQRASIPLSIPAHAIFVTQETAERKTSKATQIHVQRRVALQHVELFKLLNQEELDHIADHLIPAPFAKGDVITRQGAEAHWLYILLEGQAEVTLEKDGESLKISELGPGSVFGEMGLMTGERRASTVIARTDVECFRLDKESFTSILKARPELAEGFSHILAKRRADLDAAAGNFDEERRKKLLVHSQQDILGKIRNLFGL